MNPKKANAAQKIRSMINLMIITMMTMTVVMLVVMVALCWRILGHGI